MQNSRHPNDPTPFLLKPWEDRWMSLLSGQSTQKDPAHDILHFQRVVALAKKLATAENGCLEIVVPAAWLHDWVNVPKNDPRRAQASRLSSEAVQKLLSEMNYPSQWIPAIGHAIEAHSFSANIEAKTLEAKIVQDADRLDGLGAIGIARCFATSGVLGRPFYSPVDPFCRQREPDDIQFTVDHFYRKLLKVAETLQTATGRREAAQRVELMQAYLAELEAECAPREA